MRAINPAPGPLLPVCTVSAPTRSFPEVVVAEPLFAGEPEPLAPEATSKGNVAAKPLYSRIRTSTYTAAWLKVTVTVLSPPLMFGA